MRKVLLLSILATAILGPVTAARAWWDEGHMQVAYVAYKRLTPSARDKADQLLRLNPDYKNWTAGAPDEATAKIYAFLHAATWPDDIKMESYGYTLDDPTSPKAGEIIGYGDHNQHYYWHYSDRPFSPDDTRTEEPNKVDAVTQLKAMIPALSPASGVAADVRSCDLVWTLHLVGDLHQPLHAVTRFTREIPAGDRGGNDETVIPASGESISLHAYWDGLFGGYSSPFGAAFDAGEKGGIASIGISDRDGANLDPDAWAAESRDIAIKYAYATPVSTGTNAAMLTRDYETNARNIARARAALAGARLANLLNEAFK